MNELTHMSANPETCAKYDARIEGINRIYADQKLKYKEGLKQGRKEGLEEGEQIGIEKGRAEERAKAEAEKIESARKMLSSPQLLYQKETRI